MIRSTLELIKDTASVLPVTISGLKKSGALKGLSLRNINNIIQNAHIYGRSPAALCGVAAARYPQQIAIRDDIGSVNYAELNYRVNRIASALMQHYPVNADSTVAIMCRNHRGFIEALLAASCTGAEVLLLNTDFPSEQLKQALARHPVTVMICDSEFLEIARGAEYGGEILISIMSEGTLESDEPCLDDLVLSQSKALVVAKTRSKITILTSGTTGLPKGAPRTPTPIALLGPLATLLDRIPLKTNQTILLYPPLFHGFGLGYMFVALLLGATMVLRRRFDPEQVLKDIDSLDAQVMAGVPIMYKRILLLPDHIRKKYNTQSIVAMITGGAALPIGQAKEIMNQFGPVLFNLYGSSETSFSTIACPQDLIAAPGTVGKAGSGTVIQILGEQNEVLTTGEMGGIFIGSRMIFDGYSGGGDKHRVGSLVSTGDLGYIDRCGRLFVEGRVDDMIISGGENVFPQEVEETLLALDTISDVAVLPVHDSEFGSRLVAFVVSKVHSENKLRQHVQHQLARYKMPREFIFLDELPRNPAGKVSRRMLFDEFPHLGVIGNFKKA